MSDQLKINFQLTKIDLEKREVWGRAIEEVPDGAREIMDYASSKPRFQKWSDEAKKRTALLPEDQQSLGNIRAMHGPTASGKVIALDFKDDEKAVDIGTYCADDDSWHKIITGVYTGFSVGGHYAKRWLDAKNPACTRYTADPVEISYVDAPMVPTAVFTMIKSDGSSELRKVGEPLDDQPQIVIPSDDAEASQSLDQVKAGQEVITIPVIADEHLAPNFIDETRAVVPISDPREEPIEKSDMPEWVKLFSDAVQRLETLKTAAAQERVQSETILKSIGARVGIARRDNAPLTALAGYPTESGDYGDPANWSYLLNDRARAESAIAQFNGGIKKADYSEREWHILGRRIASKVSTLLGKRYQYSPTQKAVHPIEDKVMTLPVQKVNLAPLVQQIQAAIQAGVDQIGKDPEAAKDLLMHVIGDLDGAQAVEHINPAAAPTPPMGSQEGLSEMALKAAAPTSTAAPSSTPDESYKKLADDMATLVATVAKLADDLSAEKAARQAASTPSESTPPASTATVAKADQPAPLGDLAELLKNIQTPTADPVIEALTSGDPNALLKAAQIAGTPERPDVRAVMRKAHEQAANMLAPTFAQLLTERGISRNS